MRIERTGNIEKLTPRIVDFFTRGLHAIALDEVQSAEDRRIDYDCFGGLLSIELKTLEGNPAERTNNFIDGLRDRPEFPTFYGPVSSEAIFQNMEDREKLRRDISDRLGRPIITHLKKANDQMAAHELAFPRRNRVRVMWLLNEDHPEYDPDSVAYIVTKAFGAKTEDRPRYDKIDAVIYMTERHAKPVEGLLALPTVAIHGPGVAAAPWKGAVLAHAMERWAKWNDQPIFSNYGRPTGFEAMEHIPENMPLHEAWRLSYRRNPTFENLSNEQLRDEFDEVMVLTTLFGIKTSPIKLSQEHFQIVIQRFTHIQIEMNKRGISMEIFAHKADRQLAAAARLKLPSHVIDWLKALNVSLGHN